MRNGPKTCIFKKRTSGWRSRELQPVISGIREISAAPRVVKVQSENALSRGVSPLKGSKNEKTRKQPKTEKLSPPEIGGPAKKSREPRSLGLNVVWRGHFLGPRKPLELYVPGLLDPSDGQNRSKLRQCFEHTKSHFLVLLTCNKRARKSEKKSAPGLTTNSRNGLRNQKCKLGGARFEKCPFSRHVIFPFQEA